MKTILYYFSGTGNSFVVAWDLARELGGAGVVSIPRAKPGPVDAACVGVIYPVYMFGMPLIVARFLRQVEVPADAYIFAVATMGGMAGMAVHQAEQVLTQRGLRLSAGFEVAMPGNYTPLYGAIAEERQQKMFAEEKKIVSHIAAIVKEKRTRPLGRASLKKKLFGCIYTFGAPNIPRMAKGFWASEKCNGCGVCARVCPVKNIEMVEKKPHWRDHCEQCLACLQWCPQEAVQYKRSTTGRKRYRNPYVSLEDITAGSVEK